MKTALALVALFVLTLVVTGCARQEPTLAYDPVSDEVWAGYCAAEFNVRYRDAAGDDGLRAEWKSLRDEWALIWASGQDPSLQVRDALYLEKSALQRREPPPNMEIIRQVSARLHADAEAKRFPPQLPDLAYPKDRHPQSRLVRRPE